MFLHPRENLRRVLERFAGDLSTTTIISARPLADLSPVPIAQGVTLSRRRRKSRVEALIIRAYSQSTYTQAVITNEPVLCEWIMRLTMREKKEKQEHYRSFTCKIIATVSLVSCSSETFIKKVIKRNDGYNRMRASNKVEEKCHNKAEQWIFVVVVLYCFVVVVAVDFFFVSHKDSSISHLIRHTINNSEVMSNSQITKSDKRYQVLSIVLHTL